MHLNLRKYFTITFSLKKIPIQFNYSLDNINLLIVTTILNLEVKFNTKLSFRGHINYIRNKASAK